MDQAPAVEVSQLTKYYGTGSAQVAVLRGVDLQVDAGEFVAVMGRSGSGKSTLLHLVAGLDVPSGGVVRIGGQDIAHMTDDQRTLLRRRRVGLVFQAFNLLEVLSAEENVALPLLIDGVDERQARERAERCLALVGIDHRRRHLPKEMSGGEQQRVAVARALVTDPVILLADEPTGNLDSANSDQIMNLLRNLVDDASKRSVLMVTHDAKQATMADRMIEFRDGQVVGESENAPIDRGVTAS